MNEWNDPRLSGQPVPPAEPNKTLAVIALVLGIVSVLGFWSVGIGIITGVIGLVFGILALTKKEGGMAVAGVVLSAVGLLMSVALLTAVIYALLHADEWLDALSRALRENMIEEPARDTLQELIDQAREWLRQIPWFGGR